jgi:hypothetical protein
MPSADSNALPFFERPDLSPFLVHLTKNTKSKDGYSAFRNLSSILRTGKVFGSTRSGFIKGDISASCFMDVPLTSLKYVLNERNTRPERPRYEPFGIVISKKYAYEHGCRPVLYLSDAELKALRVPTSELWRVVRLEAVDGTGVNWLHEREWRSREAFRLPSKVRAALVKDSKSAMRLQGEIDSEPKEFKARPLSIIPLSVLCQGLPYLAK